MNTYILTYIYIYTYTHIHTFTHIYKAPLYAIHCSRHVKYTSEQNRHKALPL